MHARQFARALPDGDGLDEFRSTPVRDRRTAASASHAAMLASVPASLGGLREMSIVWHPLLFSAARTWICRARLASWVIAPWGLPGSRQTSQVDFSPLGSSCRENASGDESGGLTPCGGETARTNCERLSVASFQLRKSAGSKAAGTSPSWLLLAYLCREVAEQIGANQITRPTPACSCCDVARRARRP